VGKWELEFTNDFPAYLFLFLLISKVHIKLYISTTEQRFYYIVYHETIPNH